MRTLLMRAMLASITHSRFSLPAPVQAWPLVPGKTFLGIAEDCWARKEDFLSLSHKLMVKTSLMSESSDENDFASFLKPKVWPPKAGEQFKSHVLNYEMSRQSFWKNFIPDKEVLDIAMQIAADRFREDSPFLPFFELAVELGSWAGPCCY